MNFVRKTQVKRIITGVPIPRMGKHIPLMIQLETVGILLLMFWPSAFIAKMN